VRQVLALEELVLVLVVLQPQEQLVSLERLELGERVALQQVPERLVLAPLELLARLQEVLLGQELIRHHQRCREQHLRQLSRLPGP
jgi:hypothetical protein